MSAIYTIECDHLGCFRVYIPEEGLDRCAWYSARSAACRDGWRVRPPRGPGSLSAVIAPKWRAPRRPIPGGLGVRPLLRWQVVRETRPVVHANGIVSSGAEHVSYHWTYRAARKAAWEATQ